MAKYLSPKKHFKLGLKAYKSGDLGKALTHFDKASNIERHNSLYLSFNGLLLALKKNELGRGMDLCTRAIKRTPSNTRLYLNLGLIYLEAGNKKGAIRTFERGLKFNRNDKLINKELIKLGVKKKPILPFFSRSGFVNRNLGLLIRRTLPERFGPKPFVRASDTEKTKSSSQSKSGN